MKSLIVDDILENRLLLYSIIHPFGPCDQAANGLEAVDLVEAAIADEIPYDLILLDIMMPKMDGQRALRTIRTLEQEYGFSGSNEAVILMVTAVDTPEAATEAFFTGYCTDYLLKPITRQIVLEKLQEYGLIHDWE